MRYLLLSVALLLLFYNGLLASEKDNLRKQYNSALLLLEKKEYTQAQFALETILSHSSILVKEKSSLVKIKLLSLFKLAAIYNNFATIELQLVKKNFEVIENYLKKAIRIYQKILAEKFIHKNKFAELLASTKHNLEYTKLKLFDLHAHQEALFFKTNQQKKIPILIQELKKEEEQVFKKIKELELLVQNFATQKTKDQLAKKQTKIQKKFFILQKKIHQIIKESTTDI